jgi:hypothetical protein
VTRAGSPCASFKHGRPEDVEKLTWPLIVPDLLESVIEREVHARESRRHNRRRTEPVRAIGRITVVGFELKML